MFRYFFIVFVIFCRLTVVFSQTSDIPKPHKFVGHKIGADKKLLSWQIIYDYLKVLHKKSERVILEEIGQSTLGKPFVILNISSPINLKNIVKYRNLQKQVVNPRNLTKQDVALLTREKKAVVMIVYNSNNHGIASVQGVPEFVHRLATSQSRSVQNILDNIILLLVPDLNPDGMQKIVEWYNNYLDTPHEGSLLPGLTHEYAGDEILEDWLSLNLIETQMVARQIHEKWFPEVVISINETQQLPRILIEAGTPDYDKSFENSLSELHGLVLNSANEKRTLPVFFQTANLHNQIYFKISAAKTLYGTPLFFPVGSDATQTLPSLPGRAWSGGWWGMRHIIDSEISAILSVLNWAASNKGKIIENFCIKNIEFTKNIVDDISAYFISSKQYDLSTLNSMLISLKQNGVKVYHPKKQIRVRNHIVMSSDYIIPRAQSAREFIDLMFKKSGKSPDLPARYGVKVTPLKGKIVGDLLEVKFIRKEKTITDISQKGNYLISAKSNDAYSAVNRFLNREKRVYQFREQMKVGGNVFLPGTFYIPKNEIKTDEFKSAIEDLIVDVRKIDFDFRSQKAFYLQRPQIGIYQPWKTNPDEGWTRLVLDKFGFSYQTLFGSKISSGNLSSYDVIILPDMESNTLISGWGNQAENDFTPSMPRPYLDGITPLGVENLKKYVMEGGTLIALGQTCRFASKELQLPVKILSINLETQNIQSDKIISIRTNTKNPIAFGMQDNTKAVITDGFCLQPIPWQRRTEVAAYFTNSIKASNGHPNFYLKKNLPVVLNIPMGEGRIILMSVRPQFRGQVPATYKLLFNSILNANSENVVL